MKTTKKKVALKLNKVANSKKISSIIKICIF